MQKHIIGENGISYTLAEDGMYYPDLKVAASTNHMIRKYGRMRQHYLKEHRQVEYWQLFLEGLLNQHLHEVDIECERQMKLLIQQMKTQQGVTEQMKDENQMLWVGRMNNIRNAAEEIVLKSWVYS